VLSDKPVAATWEQLETLEQVCDDSSVLLTEFDFRANPAFRAASIAVQDGLIGEPVLVTAQKSYRFGNRPEFYQRREDYGGTLLWIASHGIDAIDYVTGCRLTRVTGTGGNVAKPDYGEMEDHITAIYQMANGGSAVVHADLLRPSEAPTHGDDRIRVVGSQGQVEVRDGVCTLTTNERGPTDITATGAAADRVRDFTAALNGDTSLLSTRHSLAMARVLLASRDACDQQAWVALT